MNQSLLNLIVLDGGKVVCSFLVIGLARLDQVIENHQDTVTDCHRGFLAPASRTDPTILFAKIRLRMSRRMGRLDEHRFGPAIALTRAATPLLASCFMIARTDPHPRSRMGSVGKV